RPGWLIGRPVDNVAHHANDFGHLRFARQRRVQSYVLADGIATTKETARGLFVDDDHRLTSSPVLRREAAAAPHRNAEHGEVIGPNPMPSHNRRGRRTTAFDVEREARA